MSSPGLRPSIERPPGRRYAPLPLRSKRRSAGDSLSSAQSNIPSIVEDHSNTIPSTPDVFEFTTTSLTPASDPRSSPYTSRARSVSDLSGVSENDDNVEAYDLQDEEVPQEPFFTPKFQAALQNGLRVSERVVETIQKLSIYSGPTSHLDRLLHDAHTLSTFESSDTRTIAVLGDSGEGKSSLINALLHIPEIAKTGDIGSACTSVVTEYRQNRSTHTAPITVEVEYLSTLEIEDMIKELLWNYRQLFLPTVESDEVDSKEYARYQRESEQAFSALEAAFKHQRTFNRGLLSSDMSEAGSATITGQLIQWAHELKWPVSPDGNGTATWKSTAETAEECYEMTKVFMQDRFWPFTKIIRVYLNAQVLKTGLILADLPGLQDTNLARVRATQDYLLKCDNIFIVANIARAITDQSLKSSLYKVLSQHVSVDWEETGGKSLNLAIVCTKSEAINETTARREFCGLDKKIPTHVMEQLDKDIDIAKRSNNRLLKKELKRKQKFLLVDARNCHVRQGLRNAYSSSVPGGNLEVFCISNTTYEKFSRKGNAGMVNASGIPELRRFCHTITANAQLLEAKHFLQSSQSSLLNSVGLSMSAHSPVAGHVPDESMIRDVLRKEKLKVSKTINESETSCNQTFEELVSNCLERRNSFWEDAAEAKGLEWYPWHHTQYNAWCNNNGEHITAKRGFVNWNSNLIWKMRMELEFQWGLVEEEIPVIFDALLQSIKPQFLELSSYLSIQDHELLQSIVEAVKLRVQDIEYKFGLVLQGFIREVKVIRRYASEPNKSSYIVSEMIPAYRSAASQSGTGMKQRQHSIVQGRITNGTLFPQISAKIQDSMSKLIQTTFKRLQHSMDSILDLVESDINMALAPRWTGNAKAKETLADGKRMEELTAELNELMEKHKEVLASIADL